MLEDADITGDGFWITLSDFVPCFSTDVFTETVSVIPALSKRCSSLPLLGN